MEYICRVKNCHARGHPRDGCVFEGNDKETVQTHRNMNCIYRTSYVRKYLVSKK